MNILFVEDNALARATTKALLRDYNVTEATTYDEALHLLNSKSFDLALFDLDLDKKLAGLELTKKAEEIGLYSIILTGHDEPEITMKAYELGSEDYFQKPVTKEALREGLNRYQSRSNSSKVDSLIRNKYLTNDPKTIEELQILKSINLSSKPVLIQGPTGTGKTIIAQAIKEICNIHTEKFVAINCASFTETLLESELFGHKKGSFTGATQDKIGLLSKANGGLIYLDEVHSMSKGMQQKLMKAIEEGVFYPVGSSSPVHSSFRVVSGTCEDLVTLISEGKFRNDFYARISHIKINLFPLKERPCDILPLINHYCSKFHRKIVITPEAETTLKNLEWNSNVRDIEAIVERWNMEGIGIVTPKNIPQDLFAVPTKKSKFSKSDIKEIKEIGIKEYLDCLKLEIVQHFLEMNDGNKTETARVLKVTDTYINHSLKKSRG